MSQSPLPPTDSDGRAKPFTAVWNAQRRRADDLLAAHQSWLEQAAQLVEQQLRQIEEELAGKREEVERLTVQCNALSEQIAGGKDSQAEGGEPLPDAPGGDSIDSENDYRRLYEMALEDIREMKAVNAELQRRVERANAIAANSPAPVQHPPERLNWEAEKRRILAALESDYNEHDAQQLGERLKISEVLHTTEVVVAEKERQIQELKRQLHNQEDHVGAKPVDERTAAEWAINNDQAVQEERRRLQRMQEEWRDKLRQGEIELSIERAKLARQRAELDDRLNEKEKNNTSTPAAVSGEPPEPTTPRRWLAKLGLTEADRERRRYP